MKQIYLHLRVAAPSCVMHIDPDPIPTLRPSTPASIKFFVCAAVTTAKNACRFYQLIKLRFEKILSY